MSDRVTKTMLEEAAVGLSKDTGRSFEVDNFCGAWRLNSVTNGSCVDALGTGYTTKKLLLQFIAAYRSGINLGKELKNV